MKNLVILSLAICVSVSFFGSSAHAHDHGHKHENTNVFIVPTERYNELVHHLEEYIETSKQFSVPVSTDDERKLGETLLKETFTQFKEIIDLKGDPGYVDRVVLYTKMVVLPKLNPMNLGRQLLDVARKVGPRFAITIATIEILENLTYVAAAYNPKFAVLIPVVFFHGYDAIGYTYIFGVPFVFERAGIYKRFGGIKKGPEEFYKFLLNQKENLPLDWSVVVDTQKIVLPIDGISTEVDLIVLKKNILERFVSPKYKNVIFPRRTAQRETSNALSITELERLAKSLGIKLHTYRGLLQEPPLYSRMLLEEIMLHSEGPTLVANKLKENSGKIVTTPLKDTSFNAEQIFHSSSAKDLLLLGESPDILALRMSWYILGQAEEIKESKETQKIDYKLLRQIVAIANKDLKKISETDFAKNPEAGFESIFKSMTEVKSLIKQFQSRPKLCRAVLLSL